MTYWVAARDNDGKIFIGIITGMDGRRIHHWLQIDASVPHQLTIEGIPVIIFKLFTDGPIAVEPCWAKARLKLKKNWRSSGYARYHWVRSVKLHISRGPALWAHSWGTDGAPSLIPTPAGTAISDSNRRCLNATLIQAGMMRHIYSTRRHIRMEDPEVPHRDDRDDWDGVEIISDEVVPITAEEAAEEATVETEETATAVSEPEALKNTPDNGGRGQTGGERPHKSRNLPV